MKHISIRVAEDDESYIDITMVDLCKDEIVLKEHHTRGSKRCRWERVPVEDVIDEILVHEVIHVVIKNLEGELVSSAMDEVTGWSGKEPKIVFGITKKAKK